MSADAQYDPVEIITGALTSEQKLLLAVMRRAVWDYVLHRTACTADKRYLAEDARRWLFNYVEDDLDPRGRYSFEYACEMLGLDADSVRRGVERLRPEDIQRLNNKLKDT